MTKEKDPVREAIKQQRKQLGITQKELASRSGVGLRFIRDLEQGKPSIRMDKLQIVLDYLGLILEVKRKV